MSYVSSCDQLLVYRLSHIKLPYLTRTVFGGIAADHVQCDEEGPPCRACRSLQIPCTFNRPSRRRGPPNRHAEAIKRQKLDVNSSPAGDIPVNGIHQSPTTSTTLGSPATLSHPPPPNSKPLSAESICPFELLTLLIDDFFVYVHPLHPFPHEPSFRTALFQERRDTRDARFLALAASMIGCLVSTYPRQPLKRLKETQRQHLFPSSHDFVTRCRNVALEARGWDLLGRSNLNVGDAATSFFLGQIATSTYTVASAELYFSECYGILHSMGYQRFHDKGLSQSGSGPDIGALGQSPSTPQHANIIDREMGNRLYWDLYNVVRTAFTFGFMSGIADVNINPHTPIRPHPSYPLEVDDDRIFPDHIEPQPDGTPTPVTALNHVCRMHMQFEPIRVSEHAVVFN